MPGDSPRLLEALPRKDHFHYQLTVLVFSSERRILRILGALNPVLVAILL